MPITTWIRDLLGIPKDVIDLKKSKLELENLKDEKRERDLVSRATLEDVKKYDPKYHALDREIRRRETRPSVPPLAMSPRMTIIWLLVILLGIVVAIYRACA